MAPLRAIATLNQAVLYAQHEREVRRQSIGLPKIKAGTYRVDRCYSDRAQNTRDREGKAEHPAPHRSWPQRLCAFIELQPR